MLAVALDAVDLVVDLFIVLKLEWLRVSRSGMVNDLLVNPLNQSKILAWLERIGGCDWGSIISLHNVRIGSVCLVVPVPE